MPAKFSWKDYETQLLRCVETTAKNAMSEYPDERYYAAVLHEFYREEGDMISPPCLALNTEEELENHQYSRWSSADWFWNELEFADKKLSKLHQQLNSEASRLDTEHWRQVNEKWMESLVRVAKKLTTRLKKLPSATKDFGFYLFDYGDAEYEIDLIRQCMTPAKFKRIFPKLHEQWESAQARRKLPVSKQMEKYKEDLYEYKDEILAQGKAAIPLLVEMLTDEDDGWAAADLLGEIGIADENAIRELRKGAAKPEERRFHETTALGALGDIEHLLKLAKNKKTRPNAVAGIKAIYANSNLPLDYEPIEKLLAIKECRKLAERDEGYSHFPNALPSREIKASDMDEAVRGINSKFRIIREHAVRCLGDRSLGKSVSTRAMENIVACFDDRAINVRCLAAFNIGYWKKAAKPHLPAIRKLAKNDPDPDVRESARYSIREMGFKV